MAFNKTVRRIAIVGTGVIGASWAAQYLARGFDVVATDPAPNAETNLRRYVDDAWPALTTIGLSADASRGRAAGSRRTRHCWGCCSCALGIPDPSPDPMNKGVRPMTEHVKIARRMAPSWRSSSHGPKRKMRCRTQCTGR